MDGLYDTFPWLDPTGWENPGEWLGGLVGSGIGSGVSKAAGGLFGEEKSGGSEIQLPGKGAGIPVFAIGAILGLILLVVIIISMKK